MAKRTNAICCNRPFSFVLLDHHPGSNRTTLTPIPSTFFPSIFPAAVMRFRPLAFTFVPFHLRGLHRLRPLFNLPRLMFDWLLRSLFKLSWPLLVLLRLLFALSWPLFVLLREMLPRYRFTRLVTVMLGTNCLLLLDVARIVLVRILALVIR